MSGKPNKTKFHPYRILVLLLYGQYSWVKWDDGSCSFRTTPLARLMRITNNRLRKYMVWLEEQKYVKDVKLSNGSIRFTLVYPPNLPQYNEYSGEGVDFVLDAVSVREADVSPSSSKISPEMKLDPSKRIMANAPNESESSESELSEENPWFN